jgi:type IV secretory pathway TrbD component
MAIRIATRALVYFATVFGAGFVLGAVRTVFVAPRLGDRVAELAESPLMLLVVYLVARRLVRRESRLTTQMEWRAVGWLALGLMLLSEFTVVLWIRGLSLSTYFANRDPVSGGVYLASLVVFATCPWLVFRYQLRASVPPSEHAA